MTCFKIPTIESERLIFREFREECDFDAYAHFYASEQTRYYGGPLDRSSAWRAASAMMGHWIIRGYGAWAIEEKATGDFCGIVGLWYPEGWPEREISWSIVTEKQGQGFAYEAAIRARRYAREVLGWDAVHSCIVDGNNASIGLAKKLGAVLEREEQHPTRGKFLIFRHEDPIAASPNPTKNRGETDT
ncbi:ribosomal-protein-alanine N-acetyltransferase [Labrenzia sp. EL_159]|nr:ribosomal-protein-alanine N-acetyltransferase [Labrenzia sp. EL_162]MBG6193957.1 ribosomal-protein-alanine N-acetyltransferase [Labrenzia sp. EL_159]